MNAKHTPGPWGVTHQTLTDQSWDVVSEAISGGICVATCGCCESESSHIAANAHLIAAAPELLQACKAVLAWIESHSDEEWRHDHAGSEEVLQSAIAKAEGKS